VTAARLVDAVPAGSSLLLDSSVVLAYLAGGEVASAPATLVMDGFLRSQRNRGVISTVTVSETLVRAHQLDAANELWPILLDFPGLEIRPVDFLVAAEGARLRARSCVGTPDALILATGVMTSCAALVTNDKGFAKAARDLVPEMAVHLLSDFV
jgi:predicted nucleic acid-binding protein